MKIQANELILGISAKKQAGKSSLCDGLLKVFPHGSVHIFSFADALKDFCTDVLGLRHEQVWGSDSDKNSLTEYKWDFLPEYIRWNNCPNIDVYISEYEYLSNRSSLSSTNLRSGHMTAREIMQVIGTDIFRNIFDQNIWAKATIRKIKQRSKNVSLIADVRFPSEVDAILDNNGYIIRLTRSENQDKHISETALDDFDWYEAQKNGRVFVIDNTNMSIDEVNAEAIKILLQIIPQPDGAKGT